MSGISIFSNTAESGLKRLQFNFWTRSKPRKYWVKKEVMYLDIGIEIDGGEKTNIIIYIPYSITNKEVKCIGKKLREIGLAELMFNEDCSIEQADNDYFLLTVDKKEIKVHCFEKDSIDVTSRHGGKLITLTLPECPPTTNRYTRLRLDLSKLNGYFSKQTKPLGSWLQSVRTKNREVDFRVNSKRSIPQSLRNDEALHLCDIDTTHFFHISTSEEFLTFQNHPVTSSRYLETLYWNNYLDEKNHLNEKLCANHWKFNKDKEVSLFFRTNFPMTNFLSIFVHLLFIGTFAIMTNIVSTYLLENYKSINKKNISEKTKISER